MAADVLLSVSLAEYDRNGDTMLVWSYPSIDSDFDSHILKRAKLLMEQKQTRLVWTRVQNSWCYMLPVVVSTKDAAVRHLRAYTVCVQAKGFEPERFGGLAGALGAAYKAKGTPLALLQAWLSVFTTGRVEGFVDSGLEAEAGLGRGGLREVVSALGEGAVTVWAAVLLKKRLALYHPDILTLQAALRPLPGLAWHRRDWSILRPFCTGEEASELEGGFFCAACLHPQEGAEGAWDVYVDLAARSVTVAAHTAKDFGATSVHRDMARLFANAPEMEEEEVLEAVSAKTAELLAKLQVLVEEEEGAGLTLASLTEQLPNAALANFLFGVALAEGLAATD